MDFVEGLFSFLGGALRVLVGLLEAADFVDLLGWWILYVIPAPVCAAGAYFALGGSVHQTLASAGAVLSFIAGVVMTVAWARKAETVGYVLWGATAASAVLLLVRFSQS